MGVATIALTRVHHRLGTGFKAGKLIVNIIKTGPRPLLVTEKV
jgi:hypothetical protein